jgi:hypothetical protein
MSFLKPTAIAFASCIVAGVLSLTSCASVKTFNMAKVEDALSRAFQKSEEISGQMKADLGQKKTLMESLSKSKSPKFKEVEIDLKTKMANMEKFIAAANTHSKAMMAARGDISSLGYSNKEIRGDEPEYARVEEAVRGFETAAAEFTAAASEYSRESNSLADQVAAKKLFFNFEVTEFLKRTQTALDSARANHDSMSREIARAEEVRAGADDEARRAPVELALNQMIAIQKEHAGRVQELSNSMTEMGNLSKGQTKIPSTAGIWNEVQRVVNEADRATLTLNELFKDFQTKAGRVREPPKAQ